MAQKKGLHSTYRSLIDKAFSQYSRYVSTANKIGWAKKYAVETAYFKSACNWNSV